ncbi:MAG TPA: fumarylacetoacetate hydrolase family protein [Ideonella sp.]|nr:fumarylacetoacetate hydrolase family protein [Ideonella sp.]
MTQDDRMNPLAQALSRAYATGGHLPAALSAAEWEGVLGSADQAYAVQAQVAIARGCPTHGPALFWKSGGGSREAVLTHAALAPAGVRASPADISDMPFHTPGVESEIALRLGRDVSPELAAALTPETAVALFDAMAVSVEIVDSRWAEAGRAPALLRLADAQSHGALAIGEWQPLREIDWAAQRCELAIGDQPLIVRSGSHPLGHPFWGMPAWLRHLTRAGQTVPAGTAVTTGTWTGLVPVSAGQRLRVAFDGIGAVELTV